MTTHTPEGGVVLDAVIVGAGFSGLHALYKFRQKGLKVLLLEAADGVGGTWYWNCYPGARVDIESLEYSLDIPEIQEEWHWTERYASQPELVAYMEFVTDRLGLRPDICFKHRLTAATFIDSDHAWRLTVSDESGEAHRTLEFDTRNLVLATGFLSAPLWPDIAGLDDFRGKRLHTAAWPAENVDLQGKRVGLIGTGASGVQIVQTTSSEVGSLTVFQRTASWAFPLGNEPMNPAYESWVKQQYPYIRELEVTRSGSGRVLFANEIQEVPSPAADLTKEAVQAEWERRWAIGGLGAVNRTYSDLLTNTVANDWLREFWTIKIRQAVKDPETAEKLIPTCRPLTRRPPGEQGYYAAFNRDNVHLVDVATDPIDRVVAEGVRQRSGAVTEIDVLICATGFDAGSGAATRIDIRGRGGRTLTDHWSDGVRTYLGLMVSGFPNLYLLNGPQGPGPFFNPPVLSGIQADLLLDIFARASEQHAAEVETSPAAEDSWSSLCDRLIAETLIIETDSWWLGTNVPGKPRRAVGYRGGLPAYLGAARTGLEDGSFQFL